MTQQFSAFFGVLKKEFSLQGHFRLSILSRLLIGPVISAITAGLLYSGFFKADGELSLGTLNRHNFAPNLIFGFLIHTALNSGYYFLSTKLLTEKWMNTLPLIWISPCPKSIMLSAIAAVEALRCFILSALCFIFISYYHPFSWLTFSMEWLLILFTFMLGCGLGLLRTCLGMLNKGQTDLLDQFYLVLVFTSCLYIPKALLPRFLWPFCESNPIYHLREAMVHTWDADLSAVFPHISIVFLSLVGLSALISLVWNFFRNRLIENSFA